MSASNTFNSGQMQLSFQNERRVFRVSELNAAVQHRFEAEFRSIWVAGEISGCRTATSGHYYFSLKDSASQLKCALFKGNARFARFKPQDGLAVIARGNLEVYEARGEYQLIVEMLEPQGAGALQLAFEQLKRTLAAEGLFDPARKRALPKLPRRIGVITSPSGAVIRDILHVLERRFPGVHIRLFPAQVQGEGSVDQLCAGLNYFSQSGWPDVVILARGGGSMEDLWSFNEEAVARAIAASSIPVISAVGHETDFTIADFVADCRAPTPSAAAEIAICTLESLLEQIAGLQAKATQGLRYRLLCGWRDLNNRGTERAASLIHRSLGRRSQQVDDLDYRIRRLQGRLLENCSKRLTELTGRLQRSDVRLRFGQCRHSRELLHDRLVQSMERKLLKLNRAQESLHTQAGQLSPLAVLRRGYAIVQDHSGHALRSAAEASVGDQLKIRLGSGELSASVSSHRNDAGSYEQ